MKNPFERFMRPREVSQESAEDIMLDVMSKAFLKGVNYFSLRNAYEAAKKLNQEKHLGLTRNLLLNMLQDVADANVEDADRLLNPNIKQDIGQEVERIRKEEQDEPQVL